MTTPVNEPGPGPTSRGTGVWLRTRPRTAIGWWAIVLSVIGLASWVILPLITTIFGETYPVTDSWVMPAIGTVLIDAAAVLNVLCIWPFRERSVLNIIALCVTVPLALLFTLFVVGEGLSGA